MTTTQDLTTMEPCEIDGILFPLWAERWRETQYLLNYIEINERDEAKGRRPAYAKQEQAIRDRLAEIALAIEPLQAEFKRRGGWTRFDFVPDGHLHHYGCHTLRPTTVRLLVAEASGQTDEWIVEHFAYAACTYCFPDAPVEARETYLREQREAKAAERAQAKAERDAKKAEKNLVSPITMTESGGYRTRIETVYAAKQWLKSYCEWQVWSGGHVSYPDVGAEQVRAALRLKGITDVEISKMEAKWTKAASK
jgi:hypothetical protein